jgi:hypothetical protein
MKTWSSFALNGTFNYFSYFWLTEISYVMKLFISFLLLMVLTIPAFAQNKTSGNPKARVTVYYFHPNDRCPIDQAIEENAGKTLQSYFQSALKNGTLVFRVLNTDDKANARLVSGFDINAQALYLVKNENGKEIKTDLTKFAFDYGKSNPAKFKSGLKEEIEKALK